VDLWILWIPWNLWSLWILWISVDFISNLLLTVCLGIQVEWLASLFPFSEYKHGSPSFYFKT
jgi:hypothetical protein